MRSPARSGSRSGWQLVLCVDAMTRKRGSMSVRRYARRLRPRLKRAAAMLEARIDPPSRANDNGDAEWAAELNEFCAEQSTFGATCWSLIIACQAARRAERASEPSPEVEAVMLLAQDALCNRLRCSFATVQKYRREQFARLTRRQRAARLVQDAATGQLWLRCLTDWFAQRLHSSGPTPPRIFYRTARLLGVREYLARAEFRHTRLQWSIDRAAERLRCCTAGLERRRLTAARVMLNLLSDRASRSNICDGPALQ